MRWQFIRAWLLYTWGGLHRYFGNANDIRSEHERAIHYFSRAYEVDPKFRMARLARAVLLWRELGRVDEALTELTALIDADPTYGEAIFNRAMALQSKMDYQAAIIDLEAYLQLPDEHVYNKEAGRMITALRTFLDSEEPA